MIGEIEQLCSIVGSWNEKMEMSSSSFQQAVSFLEGLRRQAEIIVLDVNQYVDQAYNQEKQDLDEDQKQLVEFYNNAERWVKRGRVLYEKMLSANTKFTEHVKLNTDLSKKLLNDPLLKPFQDQLKSRQGSIEITARMLSRQLDSVNTKGLLNTLSFANKLPPLGRDGWYELLKDDTDKTSIQKKVKEKLKSLSRDRWRIVSDVRNGADECGKNFLSFAGQKLLPVLDAIDEGGKYAREFTRKLREKQYDEQADTFAQWSSIYEVLREELIKVLGQVGIHPMKAERGLLADFERHEPVETDGDNELPDEHIKEVVRSRYEYDEGYDNENSRRLVLRAAQVIIVKNEG